MCGWLRGVNAWTGFVGVKEEGGIGWCEGGRRDREGVGDLREWAEGRVGGRS